MANVMSMKKLRNKPSRNGFDLSRKNIFSAKVGELLPVMCVECIPGDKFNLNVKNLTRTMPINTAAYTRIREYFDFFFVPTELLWHKYNTWVSQMTDNNQHAASITGNTTLTDRHPYISFRALLNKIGDEWESMNPLGYHRLHGSVKLLNYLNYGQLTVQNGAPYTIGHRPTEDFAINPFPLLAYQKIYADFFRNSQWENSYSPSFNIDYIRGDNDLEIPISSASTAYGQLWDLRYCNWNKDLFMGILPNSQYGDAASVAVASPVPESVTSFQTNGNYLYNVLNAGSSLSPYIYQRSAYSSSAPSALLSRSQNSDGAIPFGLTSDDVARLRTSLGLDNSNSSRFTIIALRQAEALQKWQEITQSQQKDYKSQMEAHFGVSLSDAYSDRCQYIDGYVNNVDINEVVNTNISDTNAAEIAGKGIGVGDGNISFSTDVHGYFMCIYHAVPLLDYAISGMDKHNLKTYVTDYAIPELDAIGMVEVPWVELNSVEFDKDNTGSSTFGFAPRYYDYKTAVDRVHGAFVDGGLESWVAPLTDQYMSNILNVEAGGSNPNYQVNYRYFKVNPNILDPIFAVAAQSGVSSDQLLVNSSFDIKAVRNLDYNGLPY